MALHPALVKAYLADLARLDELINEDIREGHQELASAFRRLVDIGNGDPRRLWDNPGNRDSWSSRSAGKCAGVRLRFLFGSLGAARGIRTPDPIITNDVLYQLS